MLRAMLSAEKSCCGESKLLVASRLTCPENGVSAKKLPAARRCSDGPVEEIHRHQPAGEAAIRIVLEQETGRNRHILQDTSTSVAEPPRGFATVVFAAVNFIAIAGRRWRSDLILGSILGG